MAIKRCHAGSNYNLCHSSRNDTYKYRCCALQKPLAGAHLISSSQSEKLTKGQMKFVVYDDSPFYGQAFYKCVRQASAHLVVVHPVHLCMSICQCTRVYWRLHEYVSRCIQLRLWYEHVERGAHSRACFARRSHQCTSTYARWTSPDAGGRRLLSSVWIRFLLRNTCVMMKRL